ncbi:MAG: hypothetical protein ACR2PL_15545 [Dehalococcoidia bacterium]
MLALAQEAGHPALLLGAHLAMAQAMFWVGQFQHAQQHYSAALAHYDFERHRPRGFRAGQDPGIVARLYLALVLCFLGYPDQALAQCDQALEFARSLEHPFSLAFALTTSYWIHQVQRDPTTSRQLAPEALALSEEHGFALWRGNSIASLGVALIELGALEEGIERLTEGIAQLHAIGMELNDPYYLSLLARAHHLAGRCEPGMAVLARAIEISNQTDERYYRAELPRLRGELLLSISPANAAQAESEFRLALEIAREQRAKLLALRAPMSLYRLRRDTGGNLAARQSLLSVYDSFTEGFTPRDLVEARALLELDEPLPDASPARGN